MQPDPTTHPADHASARPSLSDEPAPTLRLERRVDGKLWLTQGGVELAVELVRCFPWGAPERFLSLRDAAGEEIAFIADPAELDPGSRAALEATLARSSFVLEITAITSIEEDFELRSWRVETARGPRTFQTPLDVWPRRLEGGAIVLEDVHGDVYRVTRPAGLDPRSRKLLWAFVD